MNYKDRILIIVFSITVIQTAIVMGHDIFRGVEHTQGNFIGTAMVNFFLTMPAVFFGLYITRKKDNSLFIAGIITIVYASVIRAAGLFLTVMGVGYSSDFMTVFVPEVVAMFALSFAVIEYLKRRTSRN